MRVERRKKEGERLSFMGGSSRRKGRGRNGKKERRKEIGQMDSER